MLDEPTNDVDTDMLTATEDLLDSWPGTLIVVSHDRYLLERVTDQQYAMLDGRLRHLPGGVDEYLRLAAARGPAVTRARPRHPRSPPRRTARRCPAPTAPAEKELASIDRNWPGWPSGSPPSTPSSPSMTSPTTSGSLG